jgi:hypothetical protein
MPLAGEREKHSKLDQKVMGELRWAGSPLGGIAKERLYVDRDGELTNRSVR